MKSKKFTYILLLCVAAVWGIIFYRIYAAMAEEELPLPDAPTAKTAYFKLINHEEDQVVLDLSYRNPFTKESAPVSLPAVKQNNIQKPAAQFMPPPQLNWPAIQYTGYIYNPASKQKLALVLINGKEMMLSEGQKLNGVMLVKNAGDSIKVSYQNSSKYFRIK